MNFDKFKFLKSENFFLYLMTAILLFINYYHFSLQTFFPEVEVKRIKKRNLDKY